MRCTFEGTFTATEQDQVRQAFQQLQSQVAPQDDRTMRWTLIKTAGIVETTIVATCSHRGVVVRAPSVPALVDALNNHRHRIGRPAEERRHERETPVRTRAGSRPTMAN